MGVSPRAHYDAMGRTTRQDLPNGTYSETSFTPWSHSASDPNDTVSGATDYVSARSGLAIDDPEYIALAQAQSNADTPITVHLDSLGREIASVEVIESAHELTEQASLDIRGLSVATIDRRGLTASTRAYDRMGRVLLETSMDAGPLGVSGGESGSG